MCGPKFGIINWKSRQTQLHKKKMAENNETKKEEKLIELFRKKCLKNEIFC